MSPAPNGRPGHDIYRRFSHIVCLLREILFMATIRKISLTSAGVLSIVNFLMIFPNGSDESKLTQLFFSVVFSIWLGLPFLILGQAKIFSRFPKLFGGLWFIGFAGTILVFVDVMFITRSSTAGIAMITFPLIVLILYGIAGLVLSLYESFKN